VRLLARHRIILSKLGPLLLFLLLFFPLPPFIKPEDRAEGAACAWAALAWYLQLAALPSAPAAPTREWSTVLPLTRRASFIMASFIMASFIMASFIMASFIMASVCKPLLLQNLVPLGLQVLVHHDLLFPLPVPGLLDDGRQGEVADCL